MRRRAGVAIVALSFAAAAQADPGDASDPIGQLLRDKGLAAMLVAPAGAAAGPVAAGPVAAGEHKPATLLTHVGDGASEMIVQALGFLGLRYRRGGQSAETGFDCSGFVRHLYRASFGIVLPRRADEQATSPAVVAVERGDLRPGDLVFFNTLRRTFSHVGIYIGDDRFIHSPRSGEDVRTENMNMAYWARRFTGARRVVEAVVPAAAAAASGAAPSPSS